MDRFKMKEWARAAVGRHYLKSMLVSFVFYVAIFTALYFVTYGATFSFGYSSIFIVGILESFIKEGSVTTDSVIATSLGAVAFFFVGIVLLAVGYVGKALLVNPIHVGCKKFMCDSLNSEEAKLGDMGCGFRGNYKNIAKVMFIRDIYITLWSIFWLFIYFIVFIPVLMGGVYVTDYISGIYAEVIAVMWIIFFTLLVTAICLLFYVPLYIKTLHYMFIPYILAENPTMGRKDVFALSKQMVTGRKWELFKLHMSFGWWMLLASCTCYILHFLYVGPYFDYAAAASYKVLKAQTERNNTVC